MIRTLLYDPATGACTAGGEEQIETWRASGEHVLWADFFQQPEQPERDLLVEVFGIHPLAVQDAQRDRHPAKIERFREHTFLLLKGLDASTEDLEFGTIQIAMFVGPRFLLTRHSGESVSIDRLWSRACADGALLGRGPDAMAILLSSVIVDRYLPILLALETRLDELEEEMIAQPHDLLLAELVGHKANLKKLRRIITYHVQLFASMKASIPAGIREALQHEINDVYEHLERTMSLAGLYYELAADLMDGYISMASHRLNRIMKILTIITAIFVPLSFLAGIYGMNFEYMPELGVRYAYFVLLGIMLGIAGCLLLLFRRKGWL